MFMYQKNIRSINIVKIALLSKLIHRLKTIPYQNTSWPFLFFLAAEFNKQILKLIWKFGRARYPKQS